MRTESVIAELLDRHGRTFASEAGIRLKRNEPSPLFRLLCLSLLISARISADLAMSATKALADAGWTTPDKMRDSSWEDRVRVLNDAGYGRYDESTARYLADTTGLLVERYDGDLRELREAAGHVRATEHELLTDFTGIGPAGADVFLREVQLVWPEVEPHVDDRTIESASRLGLPESPEELRELVPDTATFTRLVAALVRSGLAGDAEEIRDTGSS